MQSLPVSGLINLIQVHKQYSSQVNHEIERAVQE